MLIALVAGVGLAAVTREKGNSSWCLKHDASRSKRPAGIDRHWHDATLRLAHNKTVNKATVLGAEGNPDDVAQIALTRLRVNVADSGKCFTVDHGGRI